MNIAILIGVSTYKAAAPLPACAADVEQMRRLLHATNKYDDICCLTEKTNSDQLKDALRAFFARYQNTPNLTEVLVYFSGHGVYHADALLCCSDYDPNRPASTSISNEELDALLRSVSPDVAVKIIDACQSGSPYIKDASPAFEKALQKSQLNSFICMASSRLDQSSYATSEESAFTAKLIDAALYKQDGTVLYRDIQAALADAFVNTPEQTPFFVIQGTGLECFSVVTDEMRRLTAERTKGVAPATPEDTIADIVAIEIARLDEQYISPDEASQSVEQAGHDLEGEGIIEPLVGRFYKKTVTIGAKLSNLPRARAVAEFAQEQGWSKNYFVSIPTEEVQVKVPKDPFAAAIASWRVTGLHKKDVEYITEIRNRPSHLVTTHGLPFEVAEVTFEAKNHPSLKAFVLYIGIVHSLTEVMVLSAIVRLAQKGWTERSPELSEIQWKYQSYLWRDVVRQPRVIWEDALKNGELAIKTYLEGLAPKKDVPPSDKPDTEAHSGKT